MTLPVKPPSPEMAVKARMWRVSHDPIGPHERKGPSQEHPCDFWDDATVAAYAASESERADRAEAAKACAFVQMINAAALAERATIAAEQAATNSAALEEEVERLKDAVMLLRMVVARKGDLLCLRDKIGQWLKANGLEGSVLRAERALSPQPPTESQAQPGDKEKS